MILEDKTQNKIICRNIKTTYGGCTGVDCTNADYEGLCLSRFQNYQQHTDQANISR